MKNTTLATLIIVSTIAVAGCTSNPRKTSFPDLPTQLMVAPAELQTIQPDSLETISINDDSASDEKLSAVTKTITSNYTIANRVRQQLIDLQLWVSTQKSLNP